MRDTLPPPPGHQITDYGPPIPAGTAAMLALFGEQDARETLDTTPDLSWLEET